MGRRINIVSFFLFFFFTYHFSLCSFFKRKTCCPPTSAVVHLQSALFGQALLWHRCCKKEIKLQNNSLSLFCPSFKKEFSLEETLTGFPKASDKYPRPCFRVTSPTSACENSSLWTKQIFGLTGRGFSPAG